MILDKQQEYVAQKVVEYFEQYKKGEGFSFALDSEHFGNLKVYFGEGNKPAKVLHPCPDYEGVPVWVGKDN